MNLDDPRSATTQSYAEIDWAHTTDVCSDVRCSCGDGFHHCTHGDGGSAQHVRCPHCQNVIRLGTQVVLSDTNINFRRQLPPHAFLQWKGTEITMTAHCRCGVQFPIVGDFTYEVDCPGCKSHYHCDPDVLITKLSAEEAAGVGVIYEVEPDDE